MITIAVSSKSFAKNEYLKDKLAAEFPDANLLFTDGNQDVLPEDQFVGFAKEADYLIVGRELVNKSSLKQLPKLKGIGKYGVGLDNIDFEDAKNSGVPVEFESGVNSWEVTELTICLMVSCLRKVSIGNQKLKQGIWAKDGGTNLSGKTVGIIGCGHIGSKVAGVLQALNCRVLINDTVDKSAVADKYGAKLATKEEIFKTADIITLHTPLTDATRYLIDENTICLMKPSATIINTARGALVSEKALIKALTERTIASAGMDVYECEPLTNENLYTLENFTGTAHIGGSSREASNKMGEAAIRGLKRIILDKVDQE
jgi:phosphoglycerate dehydrogenase-like enzyme